MASNNRITFNLNNQTEYDLDIVVHDSVNAYAAAGKFVQVDSKITANSAGQAGQVLSTAPNGGSAGMMTYMFTTSTGEQVHLTFVANNPFGNATKTTAAVEMLLSPVYSSSEQFSRVAAMHHAISGIRFSTGELIQATIVIDQVTDTPTAQVVLSRGS